MSVMAAVSIGSAVVGGVMQNKAAKKAGQAQDAAIQIQQQQQDIANDTYKDYTETYRPLEHSMVAEAQKFDSPEAYQRAAGDAAATASKQLGLARARLARTPGLDPSSAAAMAASSKLEMQGAALGAVSQNAARHSIRDQAWARKMDALGLGKGLVTNASNGMAAAGRSAMQLSDSIRAQGQADAQGAGSTIMGLANAGMQIYGKFAGA